MIGVVSLPDPLHFQVQEEALHHCVVPTISCAAHALNQGMVCNQVTVSLAGVLAVPIRMNDQPGGGLAAGDGDLKRTAHPFGSSVVTMRSATLKAWSPRAASPSPSIATDGIERRRETNDRQSDPVLLRGLLFTSDGERLVPSYTKKKGKP
jgi:hypothetical protein